MFYFLIWIIAVVQVASRSQEFNGPHYGRSQNSNPYLKNYPQVSKPTNQYPIPRPAQKHIRNTYLPPPSNSCNPPECSDVYLQGTNSYSAGPQQPHQGGNFGGNSYPASNCYGCQESPPHKPAVIHKHITVHIPPEVEKPPEYLPPEQKKPEKHYKIVFIRTPTEAPATPAPTPPPKEEKTLIYVLVKKPEEQPDFPPVPPTEPTKPEVYFVQYKSLLDQKEEHNGYESGYKTDEVVQEEVVGGQEYLSSVGYDTGLPVSYLG